LAQTEAELLDNPVAGHPALILRSPDFHSITEAVAEPVERSTPIGWWLFFLPSLALLSLLGPQPARWLGLGHHQLRVLGRDWARRDADLGHPVPVPPDLAHLD
jgi:hypothetical protein